MPDNNTTYELRVCFEAYGLNWDDDGTPVPVGLQMSIPGAKKMIPYEQLTSSLNLAAVIELLGFKGVIQPEDLRIITPEEYDERFGD